MKIVALRHYPRIVKDYAMPVAASVLRLFIVLATAAVIPGFHSRFRGGR